MFFDHGGIFLARVLGINFEFPKVLCFIFYSMIYEDISTSIEFVGGPFLYQVSQFGIMWTWCLMQHSTWLKSKTHCFRLILCHTVPFYTFADILHRRESNPCGNCCIRNMFCVHCLNTIWVEGCCSIQFHRAVKWNGKLFVVKSLFQLCNAMW